MEYTSEIPVLNDVPYELKSIEFDAEKKSFKVNGKELGDAIHGFSIMCDLKNYSVALDLRTRVRYVTYGMDGKKMGSYDKGKP